MLLTADDRYKELNAHQRAGLITFWLQTGNCLTTDGICRLTGLSRQGVEFMMEMLCGVLPIVKIDGKWQWMENN